MSDSFPADAIAQYTYPSTLNPGAPFQAPPLPRHYVQRPEPLAAIKALLLDESVSNTLVISAIYGMGGIGKSVIAAALTQDSEIQQRFPDGVLWVTLGQQPNLLSMVNLWIQALGDYDYQPTTVAAAALHLQTLLTNKKTLLVVDDVWQREHIAPFRIRETGCRVLITTRQTQIAEASRYDLDLMTLQQSLDLFTRCLPTPLSDPEKRAAAAFANAVGYLPLALELAAAQISHGMTWDELLQTFQSEMADPTALDIDSDVAFLNDEALQKRRSLAASFKLTFKLLSQQQLEYFAWFGIVPEDVSLNPQMAATLWGLSSLQAGKLLQVFRERALLLPQAQRDKSQPTYRIHDLVHDVAKNLLTHEQYLGELPGLGLTVTAAHRQLLERYYRQTQNGLWHTVPVDGYIHHYLGWHFEQSGQPELIHQLLKESSPGNDSHANGWYEACEQLGQTTIFVGDVAHAWQLAEALYEQNAAESVTLQCRYALITTTLNSVAKNVPPELIARLVKAGLWQPAQGLAHVRQTQEQVQRYRGLIALAPHLPEALMGDALSVARSIPHESYRANALNGLVSHLPTALMHEALATARSIQNWSSRAHAIIGLLPYLPELVSETWAAICRIQEESSLSDALKAVAPHLPAALMGEALAVVATMVHPVRVQALAGLAPYIPESLMGEALSFIRSMENGYQQAEALSELAPYLPESLMVEALTLAHESGRVGEALKGLAPQLPESLMRQALTLVQSIQFESSRTRALSDLIQYLPTALMTEALTMARSMQDESDRANALSVLLPYVPEIVNEALLVARSLQGEFYDESDQVDALLKLVPYAPEAVNEAVTIARSIQKKTARVSALTRLVQYMPELVDEALAVTRLIQEDYHQAQALDNRFNTLIELTQVTHKAMYKALAALTSMADDDAQSHSLDELTSFIPESLMSEALAVARSFQDRYDQEKPTLYDWLHALSELAQAAPEMMGEALTALRSIEDDDETRCHFLGELAPYIPEALMSEALTVASSMQQGRLYQDGALYQLMPHIPESLMGEVLKLACSEEDKSNWEQNLCRLAPHLPESLMGKALRLAGTVQTYGSEWTSALGCLAPYLPDALISEALTVARSINSEVSWATALGGLIPYMPEVASEALIAAQAIQDDFERARALTKLVPHIPEVVNEALIGIRSVTKENSQAFLLGKIAPHLSEELMGEALAIALTIQDDYKRISALNRLAPHVPASLMDTVLAGIRTIEKPSVRAHGLGQVVKYAPEVVSDILELISSHQPEKSHQQHKKSRSKNLGHGLAYRPPHSEFAWIIDLLGRIAPYIPPSLMNDALAIARGMDDYTRAEALSRLVSRVPEVAGEALELARKIRYEPTQVDILIRLIPHIPAAGREALATVRAIPNKSVQIDLLTKLVPHVPEALSEALTAARSLEDVHISSALQGLAPHLPELLMSDLLALTLSIQNELMRANAIHWLVPYLSESLMSRAMKTARSIQNTSARADMFHQLLPQLKVMETDVVIWQEVLHGLSYRDRTSFLDDIPKLAPAIISLSGGDIKVLQRVIDTMQDVCRQWP